jgi:type IV secretory pathway VirJ component
MGNEEQRLARIEVHVEYIRAAIEAWDERCAAHRADVEDQIDSRLAGLADGAEFARSLRWLLLLGAKLVGLAAAVAGIAKVAITLG